MDRAGRNGEGKMEECGQPTHGVVEFDRVSCLRGEDSRPAPTDVITSHEHALSASAAVVFMELPVGHLHLCPVTSFPFNETENQIELWRRREMR